jgi:hypothetical protein
MKETKEQVKPEQTETKEEVKETVNDGRSFVAKVAIVGASGSLKK